MDISILKEEGYLEALLGMGLSYGVQDVVRLKKIARKLAPKDGGHNKFLESLVVWFTVKAPRYWWAEFDTYRVGTTKQSESTVHTICRTLLSDVDFEYYTFPETIDRLNNVINRYNEEKNPEEKKELFKTIKNNLPEGYLQTRMVSTNYKVIKNICEQRTAHKLEEWDVFIRAMKAHLEHSYFIFD